MPGSALYFTGWHPGNQPKFIILFEKMGSRPVSNLYNGLCQNSHSLEIGNREWNCKFIYLWWHHQRVKCIATNGETVQAQKLLLAFAGIFPSIFFFWGIHTKGSRSRDQGWKRFHVGLEIHINFQGDFTPEWIQYENGFISLEVPCIPFVSQYRNALFLLWNVEIFSK